MEKWLSQRLTPAKAKEDRWLELATVLEQLWEDYFDPDLSRLERLRSSYLADDSDLAKRIREMGDYFSFEMPDEADRPIALAWRRLEIEYKDMELILRSVFRRHFGDFPVAWYPIFAPIDTTYGVGFKTSDYLFEEWTKNVPPEGYFLTSRGVVGVDKYGLWKYGLTKDRFRSEAHPLVVRTKPLHIVFDGFLWFYRCELGPYQTAIDIEWETNEQTEFQFGPLGVRYDYTAADVRHVDIDVFQTIRDVDNTIDFKFWPAETTWRLDMFLPFDGFGDELLPLDLVIPGYELMPLKPFGVYININEHQLPIAGERDLLTLSNTAQDREKVFPVACDIELSQTCESETATIGIDYFDGEMSLDMLPSFADVPADFAPLDYPYGGYV